VTTDSIREIREELAQLERDVKAFSSASSVTERAKTVSNEIVAAQYIATKETISGVGAVFDTLSEIQTIQNDQLGFFFADHRDTLAAMTRLRSPMDFVQLGFDHWNRRAGHVADGITRTIEVIVKERGEFSASIAGMWQPLVELVRGDWTRR
jgi:hypothetical protein